VTTAARLARPCWWPGVLAWMPRQPVGWLLLALRLVMSGAAETLASTLQIHNRGPPIRPGSIRLAEQRMQARIG
jgi:hypothetical protein